LRANSNIVLIETQHGGHCAYLSRDGGDDIHWAEATVMRYLLRVADQPVTSSEANGG
jgi:predicted alpha/beta-fold hydrolase